MPREGYPSLDEPKIQAFQTLRKYIQPVVTTKVIFGVQRNPRGMEHRHYDCPFL